MVFDCYWVGFFDSSSFSIFYLCGGYEWVCYGVLFVGYKDEVFFVG